MIRIENLHKSYGGIEVLKGASLHVDSGKVLALVGRSGHGKSVLLKHVAGLIRPNEGRILVDDQDLHSFQSQELLRFRNRLGFLFQSGALFDSMTIYENVAFPLKEKTRLNEKEIKAKALKELDLVGLLGSEQKYPSQVSGGMVKRASLARALVEEPEIMLFDEPTTGLDPITGQTILNLIDSCHKRLGFTGIIVTHEIPRIFEIVDNVAMIHEGIILYEGTPDEILSSKDTRVQSFIKGSMEWITHDLECRPGFIERIRRKKDIHAI